MKVVSLTAENYKRLQAVHIEPDGNLVVVAGRNAQGKSSVLDAIFAALRGAPSAKTTTRPVRDGESKATVEVDLGDIVVTRTWGTTDTVGKLVVKNGAGARYPSPQKLLDGMLGKLSFDPLEFAHADATTQRELLLSVVDLGINLDELADERRTAYDERTEHNRDAKRLRAQLDGLCADSDGSPAPEPVDIAALLRELERAEAAVRELERVRRAWDVANEQVKRLELELIQAKQARADLADQGRTAGAAAAEFDMESIRGRLAGAEEINRKAREAAEVEKLLQQHAEAQGAAAGCTSIIEQLDKVKADAIEHAAMPVPGLSVDDEGVTFNGIPFAQASGAEQLRVSLGIAMALNPEIRVIRITEGALLDADNLKIVEEMATARDFQVWIERVGDADGVGIVIEDGEVVS